MGKRSKGNPKRVAVSVAASCPAWLIYLIIALLMH